MDKEALRRLGWSEDLIEAMTEVTRPSVPLPMPSPVAPLDLPDVAVIGSTMLDLSSAPVIGSSELPPPKKTAQRERR